MIHVLINTAQHAIYTVSYTHLDVYKRQIYDRSLAIPHIGINKKNGEYIDSRLLLVQQ